MTVPDLDNVCRFIRIKDWDPEEKRPRPTLFKATDHKLSLYHENRVSGISRDLKALCFGSLSGAGSVVFGASVYREEASQCKTEVDAEVYFRPDDVEPAWEDWKDAHINVEATKCGKKFPLEYRSKLVARCTSGFVTPPDGF